MYKRFSKSWMKHIDFIVLDLLCLYLAYFFAYRIRHGTFVGAFEDVYLQMCYVLGLLSICMAFVLESHKNILHRGYLKELKAVIIQAAFVGVFASTYLFLVKDAGKFSRMTLGLCMVLYVVWMYIVHIIWKKVIIHVGKNIKAPRALLLIASSEVVAERMLARIRGKQIDSLKIVGFALKSNEKPHSNKEKIQDIPVVAVGETQILDYIQSYWVEEILIQTTTDSQMSNDFIDKCELMGVVVHMCLDIERNTEKVQIVERFCGFSVLTSCIQSATVMQAFIKRVMDIVGSLVGLLVTGILVVVIGPMIYVASPGPIFFAQERVGCGGRKFKIYKFRSMYMDAEERKKELMDKNQMKGLMFKMDADPRIIGSGPDGTRKGLGWFIRKTSIDEFPQFWNVLKGDMSLVGTRPPTVNEWEEYEYHHRSRLAIKPGITGLWQVSGRSDITDFEEVVKLDLQYIRNWSLSEDIKILFRTVLVVLGGVGSK